MVEVGWCGWKRVKAKDAGACVPDWDVPSINDRPRRGGIMSGGEGPGAGPGEVSVAWCAWP